MAPCGPWRSANSLQYITTIGAINNFTSSYACGYQRLQKTALGDPGGGLSDDNGDSGDNVDDDYDS